MLLMPYLEYNNWCSCCQSLLMIDATRFQTQSNNSWLSRPRLRSSFLRLRNHDHSRLWISSSTGSAVVVRDCRYRISPLFLHSKLDIYEAICYQLKLHLLPKPQIFYWALSIMTIWNKFYFSSSSSVSDPISAICCRDWMWSEVGISAQYHSSLIPLLSPPSHQSDKNISFQFLMSTKYFGAQFLIELMVETS